MRFVLSFDAISECVLTQADLISDFVSSLTVNNRKNLKEIQIFAQIYWLQGDLPHRLQHLLGGSGVCPETLTITVRHTDWLYWQYDRPLDPLAEQQWAEGVAKMASTASPPSDTARA